MLIYRTALRLMGRHAWTAPATGDDPLRDLAIDISRRWSTVAQIEPADLAAQLEIRPARIMLFDVREPNEFAVSRLIDAQLLPPRTRMAISQEIATMSPTVELVVFYCAVGVRSSIMAHRCFQLADAKTFRVANLSGGLFRWANQGRPLVNHQGATTAVHPYNRHWSQFLRNP